MASFSKVLGGHQPRSQLLAGYKTPVVRQPVDKKYVCQCCGYLLRIPVQTGCGERFCRSCSDVLLNQDDPECPVCKEQLSQKQVFRDRFAERETMSLEVFCENQERQCEWRGLLKDFDAHIALCEHKPVLCPHCNEALPGNELEAHVGRECPDVRVSCQYSEFGCHVQFTRNMEDEHNDSFVKAHLSLVRTRFEMQQQMQQATEQRMQQMRRMQQEMQQAMARMQQEFQGMQQVVDQRVQEEVHRVQRAVDQRVHQTPQEMELRLQQIQRDMQQTQRMQLQLKEQLEKSMRLTDCRLSGVERLTDGHLQSEHDMKMSLGVKQSAAQEAVEHLDLRRRLAVPEVQVSEIAGEQRAAEMLPLSARVSDRGGQERSPDGNQNVLTADMSLRVDIIDVKTTNGVLVWKIIDVCRRRQDAASDLTPSLYSSPFYTSPCGYKMCARIYLDGDGMGKGTRLSLFLVLMRGEYDALLPWPFQLRVTLMLMDQSEPGPLRRNITEVFKPDRRSASFKRPSSEMNTGSGCPMFAPVTVLDSPTYVKDDTIFVKVIVETLSSPFPPPDSNRI